MDGAFATILDDTGRLLLSLRQDLDLWNPPGGGVDPGEAPWDAVLREVHEETGLEVRVQQLASVSFKVPSGDTVFQFVCSLVDPSATPVLTDEARAHEWFSLDELPERLSPAFVRRLRRWAGDRATTHLLVDDGPSTRDWLRMLDGGEAGNRAGNSNLDG